MSIDTVTSLEEVNQAAKSLKNNKAAGPDGLQGLVFNYDGNAVLERLHKFICEIWSSKTLPQ